MTDELLKFPSTPHVSLLPGVDVRADKVLSGKKREAFLSDEIIVEEKVDGANLGISFDANANLRLQNRGQWLTPPFRGQWKPLGGWLQQNAERLFDALGSNRILFGEWCYAQHSVHYDRLPDWFLGIDVWDCNEKRFWAVDRRDALLREAGLEAVGVLGHGRFPFGDLEGMLGDSFYGDVLAEGLYLRREENGFLTARAKLVRPSFVQSIGTHWSKAGVSPNELHGG